MKNTSVILADRHPALVESIRELLDNLFDTVMMVSDEKSLIGTLERLDPNLIVADLAMPVTRAQNVAALLNEYYPDSKLIVLGNHDETEVTEGLKSMGASGYILKRSAARDLEKAVGAVIEGGTYFPLTEEGEK